MVQLSPFYIYMEPKLSGYEPEQIKQLVIEHLLPKSDDSFGQPDPDIIEAIRAADREDALKPINQYTQRNGTYKSNQPWIKRSADRDG